MRFKIEPSPAPSEKLMAMCRCSTTEIQSPLESPGWITMHLPRKPESLSSVLLYTCDRPCGLLQSLLTKTFLVLDHHFFLLLRRHLLILQELHGELALTL